MWEDGWLKRLFKWVGVGLLFIIGIFAVIILTRTPSHDRDWAAAHARLPQVQISGDRVAVENVRNFSYAAADQVANAGYFDATYNADDITGLWYGISHFHDYGLAHTFLSFEFSDGRYLVLSIEARFEQGETYHPVSGLMRSYELIYVLGEERDIIGVRSHWREERVLLYEIQIEPNRARDMFLSFMGDVRDLAATPRFYNSLTDNCTTSLLRHEASLNDAGTMFDLRVIFPGYSDEVAYERGLLDTSVDLESLRVRARVNPQAAGLDDPAFSERIRGR